MDFILLLGTVLREADSKLAQFIASPGINFAVDVASDTETVTD